MTVPEKLLYHHAHPVKIGADIVAVAAATPLFWEQHLLRGIAVGLILPTIASFIVIRFLNLEHVKQSRLGRYVGTHMSLPLHTACVIGVFILWAAAWYRSAFYCSVGLLVIAFAWVRGPLHESGQPASEIRTRSRR